MRADPVDQALRESGFRKGVARGAEHGDKQLTDTHFAGRGVDDFQRRAGVVHERACAGDMALPHGRRQPRRPGAIKLAEPAVAITIGVRAAMLFPQQPQRDARPAQFTMDGRPVRLRSSIARADPRRRIEKPLQHLIAQIVGQRPTQAGAARPPQAFARRRGADRQARRNLTFRHAAGTKPQHVAYLAHG
jgi:hypothetical protein